MGPASIGDLSRAFSLRSANSRTKSLLMTLTREVSTGLKSDLPKAVRGDTRPLAGIEHRLRILDALRRNCEEAGGRLDAGQAAMEDMQAIASGSGTALLATSMLTGTKVLDVLLTDARTNLDAGIGLLNTHHAGEFVFSGARSDTVPVITAASLLTEVTTAIGGLTDIDNIISAVDAFFDAPAGGGGYIDRAYRGAEAGPGRIPVSVERGVASDLTAASQPFRELLKGLTLAGLAAEGTIAATDSERLTVAQAAGTRILGAETRMIEARSAHGVLQETVELARTRNVAEISALQIARTEVVAIDPYETATALSEVQAQLEGLYAVTARLSQLSLARRL